MSLSVEIERTLGAFHLRSSFTSDGGVTALLGASGCGKSMTLRCIAGIDTPDRGRIVLDGVTLYDSEKHINLSPQKRRVGYLFQQYALFPNMTVWQNIQCGLRDRRKSAAVLPEMIRAMHLEGMELKKPHQLSGGQQQRVALARILVNEPNALLLDEPFSSLDSHLRFAMEQELRDAIARFGKTVILVSHNRDEVFRLSDHIAIMNDGAIETQGEKKRVFADPVTRSGAILTGCKNVSRIERLGGTRVRALDWGVELTMAREPEEDAEYVGVRMHDVRGGAGENAFDCLVVEEVENPFSYTVFLRPKDAPSALPIGWELEKADWQRIRQSEQTIHLPSAALLPLRP